MCKNPKELTVIAESPRISLVSLEASHIEPLKQIWGDESVMSLCGGASDFSKFHKTIEAYSEQQLKYGLSVYGVLDKKTEELVGTAGFNWYGDPGETELIYHFRKRSWGLGFAFEAASLCLDIAMTHSSLIRITASADSRNLASIHILEKLGFKFIAFQWFEDTQQEEPTFELLKTDMKPKGMEEM
ncbi:GNAT family N-acetyltransferase [Sporosarcina gallistercoris]|uniref:GNAT family N-acetyltransferase n=1 Tax=Sporosarcina gallistercoris TaxID=2762245 RepID=UPI001782DF51|nr:GNAT family N-acetyltransferase [Sporosarcina gallistercoris]